jgi:hypothetical protein
LIEGLSAEEFARQYGSLKDERFLREVAGLRKRIDALPGYAPSDTKQERSRQGTDSAKEKRRERK